MDIKEVKEFLDLTDGSGMKAYDYCKAKRRTDMAVVLAEFVDESKSILEIEFDYINPEYKQQMNDIYRKEIQMI